MVVRPPPSTSRRRPCVSGRPGGGIRSRAGRSSARLPKIPKDWSADALAFRIAAIRETFEECGVLLARPHGSQDLIDAATLKRLEDQHRAALNAGSIGFERDQLQGLLPAPDLLVHFAHWITPAHQPKRYDTHFFLAEAPEAHLAVHDGQEAVESIWITPAQALAETATGKYKLVFATAKNLEKLGAPAPWMKPCRPPGQPELSPCSQRGRNLKAGGAYCLSLRKPATAAASSSWISRRVLTTSSCVAEP